MLMYFYIYLFVYSLQKRKKKNICNYVSFSASPLSLVFKYILVLVLLLVVGLRLITGKLGIQVDIFRFFVLGLEKGSFCCQLPKYAINIDVLIVFHYLLYLYTHVYILVENLM